MQGSADRRHGAGRTNHIKSSHNTTISNNKAHRLHMSKVNAKIKRQALVTQKRIGSKHGSPRIIATFALHRTIDTNHTIQQFQQCLGSHDSGMYIYSMIDSVFLIDDLC